jgi:hypothetical protein
MAVHKSVVLTSLDLRSAKQHTWTFVSQYSTHHPPFDIHRKSARCIEHTACALRAPRRRRRSRARPLRRPRQRAVVSSERPTSVRHATNLRALSAFNVLLSGFGCSPASRASDGICHSRPADSGAAVCDNRHAQQQIVQCDCKFNGKRQQC